MIQKNLPDVGASKSASQIISSFDIRLRDPARIIVRAWGYLIVTFIIYLLLIGMVRENRAGVIAWILIYSSYLLGLEFVRGRWIEHYDESWFRLFRVLVNVVMMTWLVVLTADMIYILSFAYLIPIFAGIVYFTNRRWIGVVTFLTAVLCLFCREIFFARGDQNFLRLAIILLGLSVFSGLIYWLYHHAVSNAGQFSELAWEMHRTLDIHELAIRTVRNAAQITNASHALVIILDPQHESYFDHEMIGFELRDGASIENVALECKVLSSGEPFDCSDIVATFKENNIYRKFFKKQPRSILAEPLFDSEGRIIGVLNVAHNEPNHFGGLAKSQLKEFSGLVNSAMANCFSYREAKLSEARDIEDNGLFSNANSEEEIAEILREQIRSVIPHADGYVVHRFDGFQELLVPIFGWPSQESFTLEWTMNDGGGTSPTLKFGVGIAGHALQLGEPILVHNVREHPWYLRSRKPNRINSLLSTPLLDPREKTSYGTITVFTKSDHILTNFDEIRLTALAYQAAASYTRIKKLSQWREKGGVMKRVLDEVRRFDLANSEAVLSKEITSAAIHTLHFGMARLRLLDEATGELETTAVSGVPVNIANEMLGERIHRSVLEPFLSSRNRVVHSFIVPHDDEAWQEVAKRYFYIPEQTLHKRVGWRAYDALITPLLGQSGQLIGMLSLDLPEDGLMPSPEVIEAIGVFASSAASAIELARAQRGLSEQRTRAWSLLGSLGPKLATSRDFESLAELVVQFGAQILNAEGCSLYIVRGDELELTNSTFLAGTKYINRKKRISTDKNCGLSSWVAATGELLCLNNQQHKTHPAWAREEDQLAFLESKECYSLLMAPILDRDERIIGVITLENKRSKNGLEDFNDDDKGRIKALASQFAQALDMMGRHEMVQKWERKGIEDDLHDVINWYHSGVVLHLDAMAESLRRKEYSRVTKELPEVIKRAYTSVNELKTIHTDLTNLPLDNPTLYKALERMIAAWSKRTALKYEGKLAVELICPKKVTLPELIQNTLVRISSGALANTILHSGIRSDPRIYARIEIKQEGGKISLTVSDNGKGTKQLQEGYGITRMRHLTKQLERYGVIDPQFHINSNPELGTTIHVDMFVPRVSNLSVDDEKSGAGWEVRDEGEL